MPRKNPIPTMTVHPRIAVSLNDRIKELKESGPHIHDADTLFMAYLLQLGASLYASKVLPAELGDDTDSSSEPLARVAEQY